MSPFLVTGPPLASNRSVPASADSDPLPEPEFPPVAGDSPVNGTLLNGGTSSTDDILIIKCGHCTTTNVVSLAKDCWYVIFRGVGVGVQRDSVSSLAFFLTLFLLLPRMLSSI